MVFALDTSELTVAGMHCRDTACTGFQGCAWLSDDKCYEYKKSSHISDYSFNFTLHQVNKV